MSSLGGIRNRFGHGGSQLHVRAHESVKTRQENPAGEEALTSRTRPAPASVSASAGSRLERRARPRAAPLLVATRGRYRQLTRKRLLRRCAELDMGPAARGGAAGVAPATTRAPAMDWLGSGCLNYQKPRERARQSVTLSRLGRRRRHANHPHISLPKHERYLMKCASFRLCLIRKKIGF